MFNMDEIMKQAQAMQAKMQKMQEELASIEVVGEAGAGLVKVTMTGRNDVRGVGCLEVKNTDGRTWVGTIADTLLESGCKFCSACVTVLPTIARLPHSPIPARSTPTHRSACRSCA
mgnify:CR=1 FL=1